MRRWSVFVLFALVLGCSSETPQVLVGDRLVPLMSDGRWRLVNYWAIWCAPCRKEVPVLNRLAQSGAAVQVIGINFDQPPLAELKAARQQLGIEFPLLVTGNLNTPRPKGLPTSYLIDPSGQQLVILAGEQSWDSLRAALAKHGVQIP